ncbi:hypothetical protein MLD38_033752 [Melastoma candidum]|uniref:Uncharacterized protein n=1 Tax=Melastoma candidum TaxID=119954 RepID=A0ACB9M8B9_9MYRT|nr:hypothetical protein MLD38_033752 [Melastoma candidum]
MDLRRQAHRLLWAALDYIVSVEADAYFPGFNNDGSGWPDFSGLVMGHRLYEMASARTYRPDRKYVAKLLNQIIDNVYYPKRNWTLQVRIHLNESLAEDGLLREFRSSKPLSFLSHPIPECSCRNLDVAKLSVPRKGRTHDSQFSYEGEVECPSWMQHSSVSFRKQDRKNESQDYDGDAMDELPDSDEDAAAESPPAAEPDEEIDPDD